MNFEKKYLVAIQGYDENGEMNEYNDIIATFENDCDDIAIWMAETYPWAKPEGLKRAKILVQQCDPQAQYVQKIVFEKEIK